MADDGKSPCVTAGARTLVGALAKAFLTDSIGRVRAGGDEARAATWFVSCNISVGSGS